MNFSATESRTRVHEASRNASVGAERQMHQDAGQLVLDDLLQRVFLCPAGGQPPISHGVPLRTRKREDPRLRGWLQEISLQGTMVRRAAASAPRGGLGRRVVLKSRQRRSVGGNPRARR